jgi:hypothetical protein
VINSVGAPFGLPVSGETGRRQMSAFCRSIEKANLAALREIAISTSCPAPLVSCCGAPAGVPSGYIATRQILMPPPRYEEK